MELEKAIKGRRSVRIFRDKKVDDSLIERIIDAGQWAPSACNKQMWEFIVVRNKKTKDKLVKEAGAMPFLRKAPVAIYVLYKSGVNPERHANIQSASAATQNMLLVAHSMGLGGVWIVGCGEETIAKKILKIPDDYMIVNAIFIGYPKETPKPPERKAPSDITHNEHFGRDDEAVSPTPQAWSQAALESYRQNGIRATSPFKDSFPPPFPREYDEELSFVSKQAEGRVLDVLGYAGTYTIGLLSRGLAAVHTYDTSEQITRFMLRRKKILGTGGKITAKAGGLYSIPYPKSYFDSVTCFKKLEMVPEPKRLLKAIRRVLRPRGKLFLSFWNSKSIPGLNYIMRLGLKKILVPTSNEGPVMPMSIPAVRKLLKDAGFSIREEVGINLVPKRSVAKGMDLEGFVTRGPLKNLCRSVLIVCD